MIHIKDGFRGERSIVVPKFLIEQLQKDALLAALHITDIGYFPSASHHYRERKEPISEYVFIYCVEGAGSYQVGDSHYEVNANEYFILPAGLPHRYEANAENPWTIYWIHFGGTLAKEYARGISGPIAIQPELHSRINTRNNIFEELFQTMHKGLGIEQLQYTSSLFHYYLGSLRYLQQYRDPIHQSQTENQPITDVVEAAIHYMKENLEHRLTLAQLSQFLGYSPSHFSAIFHQKTGQSPLSYYNRLKMEEACYLLSHTDMHINQISAKLGIEDAYYFSRLFTKMMKISPTAYRQEKTNSLR